MFKLPGAGHVVAKAAEAAAPADVHLLADAPFEGEETATLADEASREEPGSEAMKGPIKPPVAYTPPVRCPRRRWACIRMYILQF